MDDNITCHEAPLDRVSDTPPSGTVTLRVYRAGQALEVRIRPVTGSMEVSPQGTGASTLDLQVGVYDAPGAPVPNRTVTLALTPREGTAGHVHQGGKPAGALSQVVVETGASGVATVRYAAPVASGPVAIRGTSAGAREALDTIRVRVSGLVPLLPGGGQYQLIGLPAGHAGRHHGTPGFVAALRALADSFYNRFRAQLEYNDMSLEEGGMFDLHGNWTPPHDEHRVGTNVDLRTITRTATQQDFIWRRWERLGGTVHDETGTDAPHYHLRF